jgi:hypothetical protein
VKNDFSTVKIAVYFPKKRTKSPKHNLEHKELRLEKIERYRTSRKSPLLEGVFSKT